jgi:hypothetical protein
VDDGSRLTPIARVNPPALVLRGAETHTAADAEFQDSSATVLFSFPVGCWERFVAAMTKIGELSDPGTAGAFMTSVAEAIADRRYLGEVEREILLGYLDELARK